MDIVREDELHDPYTDDERQRLWAHRLHEDLIFFERHSFFLVAQSLLVVAYAELLPTDETLAATVLTLAGVLLTVTWLLVSNRQRHIIAHVQLRALGCLREFNDTYQTRPEARGRVGVTQTMAVLVPSSFGALWVVFLLIAMF